MHCTLKFAMAISLAAALWAADKIQPLNVKVGLWEVTHTTSTSGTPPIPPEKLAKMTPKQRAEFDEHMKAKAASPPQTHTE